ncbi:septum site-determining protein MinC [Acidithiobacillus sp. M4-SHS-6]|uniref:septum site-determining protein MinC n=1 Tax=Acidithiobacillus sp. M4-SHS-6 TaxID=3383024 RepID=UPI0039BE08E6
MFTLSVLELENQDPVLLKARIDEEYRRHPSAAAFHQASPLVLDLAAIPEESPCALAEIMTVLREAGWMPVGIRNASATQQSLARSLHLPILRGQPQTSPAETPATEKNHPPPDAGGGLLIAHPVRSGQRNYARNGDLVCLATVNAGAEIIADRNIHVYGPLRGRALAGVNGDENARVFCMALEAELVSIAGLYRTLEPDHPLWGKAAQIYSREDQLHITPLNSK